MIAAVFIKTHDLQLDLEEKIANEFLETDWKHNYGVRLAASN